MGPVPRGNGDAAISCIPSLHRAPCRTYFGITAQETERMYWCQYLSQAQSGPIGGNAISVSCQNLNCLRRMRRRVIQSVKRLPFGGIFCSAIDDIKGEAKRRREGRGVQQRSAITPAINIAIRLQPESTEKFAEFVCIQHLALTVIMF